MLYVYKLVCVECMKMYSFFYKSARIFRVDNSANAYYHHRAVTGVSCLVHFNTKQPVIPATHINVGWDLHFFIYFTRQYNCKEFRGGGFNRTFRVELRSTYCRLERTKPIKRPMVIIWQPLRTQSVYLVAFSRPLERRKGKMSTVK